MTKSTIKSASSMALNRLSDDRADSGRCMLLRASCQACAIAIERVGWVGDAGEVAVFAITELVPTMGVAGTVEASTSMVLDSCPAAAAAAADDDDDDVDDDDDDADADANADGPIVKDDDDEVEVIRKEPRTGDAATLGDATA